VHLNFIFLFIVVVVVQDFNRVSYLRSVRSAAAASFA